MPRWIIPAAIFALTAPAFAQSTTTCRWVGQVWTCDQTAPPPTSQTAPRINWDILRAPNHDFSNSFQQGFAIGERMRRSRIEQERIEAETELLRAQRRVIEQGNGQGQNANPPDYIARFTAAAAPRAHLFPNFWDVVSQPDLPITVDMVILMSASPYAADIAYHLTTHRAEATAISRLPLLEAGRAIDQIEKSVREASHPVAPAAVEAPVDQ